MSDKTKKHPSLVEMWKEYQADPESKKFKAEISPMLLYAEVRNLDSFHVVTFLESEMEFLNVDKEVGWTREDANKQMTYPVPDCYPEEYAHGKLTEVWTEYIQMQNILFRTELKHVLSVFMNLPDVCMDVGTVDLLRKATTILSSSEALKPTKD